MRLPLILILFLAAFTATAAERTKVHLFKYGRTSSDPGKAAFEDFRYLIGEKLPRLASELLAENEVEGLENLAIKQIKSDEGADLALLTERVPSLDEHQTYWRDTGALMMLTGDVRQQANGDAVIRSKFFLGKLAEDLDQTLWLNLELSLTAKTFDTTNDSHSVAILYVYAGEIGQDCVNRADAFALLSAAHLRALSVAEDNEALGNRLAAYVTDELERLDIRCAN